ncbi:MAG: tetratricopeptide repeat protein [Luteimonas sp.]
MIIASRWAMPATLAILLLLLGVAYWPGLNGPFQFDDFGNLNVLGAYGPLHSWRELLLYLTSGNADPTGRPVALLSFLIDASSWPADPWPFKRTNLLLHLLNTALLTSVLMRLQVRAAKEVQLSPVSRWTPVVAAALWAAHPFFVSTTLYVIQREAMLPMAFAMLGILAWIQAVEAFKRDRNWVGWTWGIVGVGFATVLAGLSKANGLLTPALAGLVHLWFLRPAISSNCRTINRAALICLGIPTLLLCLYLAHMGWSTWGLSRISERDWSIPERLLSEPRALWSYLWRLVLPRSGGGGLFVEDFPVSRGWLQPLTTLPAILSLAAVTAWAIWQRRRFPIVTFAWMFFIVAQLMESSVVPLELYFEHRNYLAAAIFGWPIAHLLMDGRLYLAYRRTAAVLLLGALLLLTRERALVWGNAQVLSELSATHETDSIRAQVEAAGQEIERGQPVAGLARIHQAQQQHPGSVDIAINAIDFECAATGMVQGQSMAYARDALGTAVQWNYGLNEWLVSAAKDSQLKGCRGFGVEGLNALVASIGANPQSASKGRKRDLWHVRGVIALAQGNPQLAHRWFDSALLVDPDPNYALVQAAALGDAGAPALGVQHLDSYVRIRQRVTPRHLRGMADVHAWLLDHLDYYPSQLTFLRKQLQADADRQSANSRR